MTLRVFALLVALLFVSAPAVAAPFDLYAAGKYEDAIRAGAAENDAGGYAVAARAALAIAAERVPPCMDCLKRAEDLARKAIARDPKLGAPHVYLAVSLGYQARITGPISAKMRGLPDQAKAELDKALAIDPDDPWALAALGGWHVEIVRTGGAFLGNMIYGASAEAGRAQFAKALRLAPDNIALHYQYALSLSGLDIETYRREVEKALHRAVKAKPSTEYEAFARWRAQELIDALRDDDRAEFQRLLRRDQGYR